MTINASQLDPRRKVPFSELEFSWRKTEIEQFGQHYVEYYLDDDGNAIIVWDGNPSTWGEFLALFAAWCRKRGKPAF